MDNQSNKDDNNTTTKGVDSILKMYSTFKMLGITVDPSVKELCQKIDFLLSVYDTTKKPLLASSRHIHNYVYWYISKGLFNTSVSIEIGDLRVLNLLQNRSDIFPEDCYETLRFNKGVKINGRLVATKTHFATYIVGRNEEENLYDKCKNKAVKIIFILSVILSFVSCAGVLRINL